MRWREEGEEEEERRGRKGRKKGRERRGEEKGGKVSKVWMRIVVFPQNRTRGTDTCRCAALGKGERPRRIGEKEEEENDAK